MIPAGMQDAMATTGAPKAPELSVVLPVHNDASYLEATVGSYRSALDRLGRSYELILVTNACRDNSVAVCVALQNQNENVRHIDLELGGWGRAVCVGIRAARGDTICYTNLARTSAETLALLASYSFAFPEVVVKASRRTRDSFRRRFGSIVYNLECRVLFQTAVWDVNGTPKVFPRKFADLLSLERQDDLVDAEFVMRCRRNDYRIIDVPIMQTERHGGNSTTGYRSALRMYVGALRLKLENRTGQAR